MVSLDKLDREALIEILKTPKNALLKQYEKLLDMDGVSLEVTQDALEAIADKALKRKTGARGLRAIMEETMSDIMFEIPSHDDIVKVTVTAECIQNGKAPTVERKSKGASKTAFAVDEEQPEVS